MILFTHDTTRYKVKPENAAKIRAALDKPAKHKPVALSSVNLKRAYPEFKPGMSTAEYVRNFVGMNGNAMLIGLAHDCPRYYEPATMLDATQPEIVEELDPDYVEPIKTNKTKKPGAPELRLALSCILDIQPLQDASAADLWLAIGEIRKIAQYMLKG